MTTARIGNRAIASSTLRVTGAWPCGSVLRLTSTHGWSPPAGGSGRRMFGPATDDGYEQGNVPSALDSTYAGLMPTTMESGPASGWT